MTPRPTASGLGAARRRLGGDAPTAADRTALMAVVFVGYLAGAQAAYAWFGAGISPVFFPSAGLTLAVLVLTGRRCWPAVLAGAGGAELVIDLAHGSDLAASLGWVLANVAEPLAGASLLRAAVPAPDLGRRRDLLAFLAFPVAIAPALGAAIAATSTALLATGPPWPTYAARWWLGDGLGVLVVGGAIIAVATPSAVSRRANAGWPETVAVVGAAIAATVAMFVSNDLRWAYVPVILMSWIAIRLGTRSVAVTGAALALVAAQAVAGDPDLWSTLHLAPRSGLVYLQLALMVLIATAMLVAAEVTERELAVSERVRGEQMRQLLEITDAALVARPLQELLDELLACICAVLPADAAALALAEPAHGTVALRAVHGPGPSPLDGMGTVVGAPLLVDGRAIGVLEIGRRDGAALTEHEVGLLQRAADRTALALDHTRVFERERHIARTLQRSLLPDRLPGIPGAELTARLLPAGDGYDVGGDFYDAFPVGPGRWLLELGDVCGKGPEAAALTALARYTLRAEATHELRPERLLSLLNEAVLAQGSELRFCTVVLIRLDLDGAQPTVTIAAGGHPMPLILHADGRVEPSGRPGGPLIGAFPDAVYTSASRTLAPGDTLIAYTDGLLDAHAPARILSADDLAAALRAEPSRALDARVGALEAIARGTSGAPARDDIAILALALDEAAPSAVAGGARAA